MYKAQTIINEINYLKKQIDNFELELKNIQLNCKHEFAGDLYSRKCIKCSLIEVLYY